MGNEHPQPYGFASGDPSNKDKEPKSAPKNSQPLDGLGGSTPQTPNQLSSLNITEQTVGDISDKPISDISSLTIANSSASTSQKLSQQIKAKLHWSVIGVFGVLIIGIALALGFGLIDLLNHNHTAQPSSGGSQLSSLPSSKAISLNVPVGSEQNSSVLDNQTTLDVINFSGDITATGSATAASFVGNGSNLTDISASNLSSGKISDSLLDSNVTLQGNVFNAPNQLVKLDSGGLLPAVNGSKLTNLNADNISSGQIQDSLLSPDVTLLGQSIPITSIQGNIISSINGITNDGGNIQLVPGPNVSITTDTADNSVTIALPSGVGTITGVVAGTGLTGGGNANSVTLSVDNTVTLQGNAINTANGLLKLDNSGDYPNLNGSKIASIDAGNITAGKLIDTHLEPDVCLSETVCSTYAPVSSDSYYIQNTPSTQAGANFNVESGSGASVVGVLQGDSSGQTADLLDLENSGGTVVANFNNVGQLTLGTGSTGAQSGALVFGNGTNNNTIALQPSTSGTGSNIITIPNETGTICTTAASLACTTAYSGAGGNYVQLQSTSPGSSPQTGNINITGGSGGTVVATYFVGNGASLTNLNGSNIASGTVGTSFLQTSGSNGVTIQGNTFNGNSELVQDASSGGLPAIGGDNVTTLNASAINQGTINVSYLPTSGSNGVTIQGNTFNGNSELVQDASSGGLPAIGGDNVTTLNASAINQGTINVSYLPTSGSNGVTIQGNTFNGNSELVQDASSGGLPAIGGDNVTTLNASAINQGTINVSYLPTSGSNGVTIQGNTFNGASELLQATNLGYYPANNGSLIASLSASNVTSGTLQDVYLTGNIPRLNGTNSFTGSDTFTQSINASSIQDSSGLSIGSTGQSLVLQGNSNTTLTSTTGSHTITIGFTGTPTGNVTYDFDATASPSGSPYLICTTASTNCGGGGGGGGFSSSGSTGHIPVFTSSNSVGNSSVSDNGTQVTVAENTLINPSSTSTSAFVIQGTSADLLDADTTDSSIGIDEAASSTYALDVNGSVNVGNDLYVGGNEVCTSTGCNGSSGSGFYIQNGLGTQSAANFNIQSKANNAIGGIIQGDSGQTADLLDLENYGGTTIEAGFSAGGNLSINGQYEIQGTQISSSNLSDSTNLAKLNVSQSFSGNNTFTGNIIDKNASDSTIAFEIQNHVGTSNLFDADTTDSRIGIGTLTPGYTLDVNGDVNIASGSEYSIGGVPICANSGTCAPAAGSSNYIQNTPSTQAGANFNVESGSGASVVGVLQGDSSGQTADLLDLENSGGTVVANFNNVGQLTLGTGSTGAQSGALVFGNGTNNNTIALQPSTSGTGSNIITIPNETGTICTTAASLACTTAYSGAGGNYVQLQSTSPGSSPQTGNINITGGSGGTVVATYFVGNGASLTNLNGSNIASGTVGTSFLQTSGSNGVTIQGNTFNGNSELVQDASSGGLPAIGGDNVTTLNASAINQGTINVSYLPTSGSNGVTIQGNTFNGNSELVQDASSGGLPAIGGDNVTTLNASAINQGTINVSYLPTSGSNGVTIQGNTFNGNSELVQDASSGGLPAIGGDNVTTLNASAINEGQIGDTFLSGDVCTNIKPVCSTYASLSTDTNYIQNTTSTEAGNFNIQSTNGSSVVAVIEGNNSSGSDDQAADLLDLQNGGGSIVDSFNDSGSLNFGNRGTSTASVSSPGTNQIQIQGGSTTQNITSNGVTIQTSANSTAGFEIQNADGDDVFGINTNAANNLISNQGFETNSTGWSIYNAATSVGRDTTGSTLPIAAYNGVGALKIVTNNTNTNEGTKYALGAGLSTSTTYSLSFEALVSGGTFNDIAAAYSYDGTTGHEVSCGSYNTQTLSSGGWTQINCTFTTGSTAGSSSAYIVIRDTAQAVHTFWIDTVQLQNTTVSNYANFAGAINTPIVFQNGSNSTTAVQIQNAAGTSDLFVADTLNDRIEIGGIDNGPTAYVLDVQGPNGVNSANGYAYQGTAGANYNCSGAGQVLNNPVVQGGIVTGGSCGGLSQPRQIVLTPEYAGAVIDSGGQSSDIGTMTSGVDTSSGLTNGHETYYQWVSGTGTAETYDVVVAIPIPSDWSSWASTSPIKIDTKESSSGTITGYLWDSDGTQESNWGGSSPCTITTGTSWASVTACSIGSTTTHNSQNGVMLMRLRLSSSGGNTQLGNITISYNAAY